MPGFTYIQQGQCGTVTGNTTIVQPNVSWIIYLSGTIIASSSSPNGWSASSLSASSIDVCVPIFATISNLYSVQWNYGSAVYSGNFGVTATDISVWRPRASLNFLYRSVMANMHAHNLKTLTIDLSAPVAQHFDLGTWEATYIGIQTSTPSNATASGFYPPDVVVQMNGQDAVQLSTANTAFIPVLPNVSARGTVNLVNISTAPTTSTPVQVSVFAFRGA
jgi:hypothetical protein